MKLYLLMKIVIMMKAPEQLLKDLVVRLFCQIQNCCQDTLYKNEVSNQVN